MALEQPKRPVGGAYGVYLAQHRAEFTAATKGQKASAISKMAGERWGKLGEKEKAPYEKEFQVLKAKFEGDMKAFLEGGGEKKPGTRALATQKRKAKEEGRGGQEAQAREGPQQAEEARGRRLRCLPRQAPQGLREAVPRERGGRGQARGREVEGAERCPEEALRGGVQEAAGGVPGGDEELHAAGRCWWRRGWRGWGGRGGRGGGGGPRPRWGMRVRPVG